MNTQIKVLLLLTAALIAVIGFAVSPYDVATDGVELKKISLNILEDDGQKVDSLQLQKQDSIAEKQKTTEPDTCKQTFLFIGDSMLEGLSRRFDDYAGYNGHTLHTVIWYSSSSEKWGTTHTLEHFISKYHPTFIVVCLCSNELFVHDLDKRDQYIQSIVKKIGNIPFIWISPPNWKEDTGINELIIKNVGKNRYFDSTHLTLERRKDHAHPTSKAAAEWFDLVAKWMSGKETAHPVIMQTPDKDYKVASVVILQPDNPGF